MQKKQYLLLDVIVAFPFHFHFFSKKNISTKITKSHAQHRQYNKLLHKN